MFSIPDYVSFILDRLYENGYEAFLAGGCVRDFLRNAVPHDYDITTNACPAEVKRIFSDYNTINSGEKHGTIAVILKGQCVEITTYRIDGDYEDHRRPDSVIFTPYIKKDLERRDFTINSIAYNNEKGIIDPFGGAADIDNKIIRSTGDPDRRFREDALRILRALRFSSCLEFEIEKNTSQAIFRNMSLIAEISAERIREEFIKILSGKNSAAVLRKYRDVIAVFIPEISGCFGFCQNSPYHKYDVWEHTLHSINVFPYDTTVKLAMFFHDIAKPECYTEDSKGTGHFKGHAQKSAEKTRIIMKRLKFSSRETELITDLIRHHSDEMNNLYEIKKLLGIIGKEKFFLLLNIQRADAMSKQDFCTVFLDKLNWIEKNAEKIISENICCTVSQLEINGDDLKKIGLRGKEIGEMLNNILDKVMKNKLENIKSLLINYAISTLNL